MSDEIIIKPASRPGEKKEEKKKVVKKKIKKKVVKKVAKKKEKTAFEELSDKHKLFVKNYVAHFGNKTKAYMATYPNAKYETASVKGHELVRKDKVKQAIDDEYTRIWREKDTEEEKGKTYKLIKSLGNSDITDIVDIEKNTLIVKDLDSIPSEVKQWIQSVKYTKKNTKEGVDENIEVKLHPKLQALKMRAEIQNMIDKDEVKQVEIVVKPAVRPEDKNREEK